MLLLVFLILVSIPSLARHSDPSWSLQRARGESLKNELFQKMSREHFTGGRRLSYKQARRFLFGVLHLKQDETGYYIKDVYCQKKFDRTVGVGERRIPRQMRINCEHTWPQSRFSSRFPKSLQKTDLHHLFPTDNPANSARGSNILGNVANWSHVDHSCTKSKVGFVSRRRAFEPPDEHKGNAARALFYFSVRYKLKISQTEEKFLRRWHIQDPVDAAERQRNQLISQVQGNRNPFIDDPSLVGLISDF